MYRREQKQKENKFNGSVNLLADLFFFRTKKRTVPRVLVWRTANAHRPPNNEIKSERINKMREYKHQKKGSNDDFTRRISFT